MTTRRQKISVRVERVVYPKVDEDLGGAFAFHIFRTDAGTCKGKLSHRPKPGEVLELDGSWCVSKWNGQPEFSFIHADVCVPKDERAMLKYACEMTSGLGPASEEAIWAALGEKWREISVGDVRGVSPQKVCALQETVSFIETHAEKAETVAWLMSVGCTFGMAEAAFAKWKGRTREVVNEDCYRLASLPHYSFRDVDELGLTMVDESGLMLRQLMRQARQRIAKGGSVIRTSVSTFMEFIGNNPNAFRLLLRERSGTSAAFRAAVAREIQHFIAELAETPQFSIPEGPVTVKFLIRGAGRVVKLHAVRFEIIRCEADRIGKI